MISLSESPTMTLPGVAALAEAVTQHVLERSGFQERMAELSRNLMESSGLTAFMQQVGADLAGKITPQVVLAAGLNPKLLDGDLLLTVPRHKLQIVFDRLATSADAADSDELAVVAARPMTPVEAWSLYALAWVLWFALSAETLVVTGSTGQPAPFAMAELVSGVIGAVLLDERKRLP